MFIIEGRVVIVGLFCGGIDAPRVANTEQERFGGSVRDHVIVGET